MVEITHKNTTLRTAVAQAIVQVSKLETIEAVEKNLMCSNVSFYLVFSNGISYKI